MDLDGWADLFIDLFDQEPGGMSRALKQSDRKFTDSTILLDLRWHHDPESNTGKAIRAHTDPASSQQH